MRIVTNSDYKIVAILGVLITTIFFIYLIPRLFTGAIDVESEVLEERIVSGLKINSVSLEEEKDLVVFKANVINMNEEEYHLKYIKVVFNTGDNEIVGYGYIGNVLQPGEEKMMNIYINDKISKITYIKYIIET